MKNIYESIKGIIAEKHSREDLEKEAQRLSKLHNVPYDVVRHVINKETGGTWATDKVNKDSGATGIMQILPKYATNTPAGYEVDKKDLFDPYKNMNAGIKKLGQWYNTHRNKKLPSDELDVNAAKKAMASYNAGPNGEVVKDKKGNVTYRGAATYIKTGNPKHLPKETQNYIADFGGNNKIASDQSSKQVKREASSITPQMDPNSHKTVAPVVKAEPKIQDKPVPEAPKNAEVKPQVATNTENPYTPGTRDYAFKQARIDGKKEFTDPVTGQRIAVKLKENNMKNIYGVIGNILSEAKKDVMSSHLPSKEEQQRINKELRASIRSSSANSTYGLSPLSSTKYERTPETVVKHKMAADPSWGGKTFSYNQYIPAQDAVAAANTSKQSSNNSSGLQHTFSPNTMVKVLPSSNTVIKQSNTATVQVSPAPKANTVVVQQRTAPRANTSISANNTPVQKTPSTTKREMSPFEKAFDAARARGDKQFTWQDPKINQGRPYQVGTRLKGEVDAPEVKKIAPVKKSAAVVTSVTKNMNPSEKSVVIPDDEMKEIDKQKATANVSSVDSSQSTKGNPKSLRSPQDMDLTPDSDNKPAEKTDDQKKSDALWADIRKELENETPEEKAARDERIKEYKKQMNIKTNEETQMSINKKFNVSDSLYTAVMEVMKKPSQGSVPRNEKEKDLAAMSPPGHLITHGDVLKARGVKMNKSTNEGVVAMGVTTKTKSGEEHQAAPGYRVRTTFTPGKDKPETTFVKDTELDQANQVKPAQAKKDQAVKEEAEPVEEASQKLSAKERLVRSLKRAGHDTKASEKRVNDAASKAKNAYDSYVKSKGVEEGTMRNGKYVEDAPRPGTNELPIPDEGYRGPGKPLYTPVDGGKKPAKKAQPGSTTKAVEENTDTPGNSYEHQCAIHVKSESFGEGRTITTQHADPDELGNIAWYDVMFEHGIERGVPTNELEILVSESHMHSMKKKKK